MGWSGGSELMSDIIVSVKKNVPEEKTRVKIYEGIIKAMENKDWDTQDECQGEDPAFDKALKKLHPDWELN